MDTYIRRLVLGTKPPEHAQTTILLDKKMSGMTQISKV